MLEWQKLKWKWLNPLVINKRLENILVHLTNRLEQFKTNLEHLMTFNLEQLKTFNLEHLMTFNLEVIKTLILEPIKMFIQSALTSPISSIDPLVSLVTNKTISLETLITTNISTQQMSMSTEFDMHCWFLMTLRTNHITQEKFN